MLRENFMTLPSCLSFVGPEKRWTSRTGKAEMSVRECFLDQALGLLDTAASGLLLIIDVGRQGGKEVFRGEKGVFAPAVNYFAAGNQNEGACLLPGDREGSAGNADKVKD